MKPNRKYLVVGASSLVLAAGGAGATVAIGGNEDGGAAADGGAGKAKKKALSLNPGGQANSVERDPENGAAWEVEVARTDGQTVDVRLDANFGHVVTEPDHEDAKGE
jgi:hypothetical protein